MGADLYRTGFNELYNQHAPATSAAVKRRINAIKQDGPESPAAQEAQEALDQLYDLVWESGFYFRDSYNNSSLFHKLGLSWWQYDLGENYELTGDELVPLYEDVKSRSELLAYNIRDLPKDTGPDGKIDQTYFLEKYDRFLAFLKAAIDAGDTITFSV